MKVSYFYREKRNGNYSIEELFNTIKDRLQDKIVLEDFFCSHTGKRIQDMIRARKFQSEVNHITGDVNFLALGLNGEKTILTVHDIGHYENTLTGWKKIFYKYFWLILPFKKVKYITTVSDFTKQNIIRHFNISPDKIIVIHNPVSEIFRYTPHKFNKEKPVILQIGSGRNKNVLRLIDAVKTIPCQLVLINKASPELKETLDKSGIDYQIKSNLTYSQVVEAYQNCDLLFFASEYEGFGLPIIEANAVGRPVLTGNVSAMPEVAGDAACLVNPYDTNEIQKGILKIIHDDEYRESLVRKGIENAQRFDVNKISQDYLNLYSKIISR